MKDEVGHATPALTRQSGNSEAPSVNVLQSTRNGDSDENGVFTLEVLVELGEVVKAVLKRLKGGGKHDAKPP